MGNADNLNKLTKKSDGTAKTIEEIEEEFLISAISPPKPTGSGSVGGTLPPEIIDKVWDELRPWIEEYLKDLNKSILDHAREKFRRDIENWLRWQQREYNRQLEEYQRLLKELRTIKELIDKYQSIREKELLDRLSRRNELIAKGYSDRDIELIKKWDLLDQEIPDLNAEKRIGATNILYTQGEGQNKIGGSCDLIIFLKPQSEKLPRAPPKINFSIDLGEYQNYYKEIIHSFLNQKEKFNQNDVYVLVRVLNSARGDSAGIAFYLTLHSLINQIPLPRNLGSTGTLWDKNRSNWRTKS
ncbi:MAG: hypothetical protein MRECE_34c008 [Mycoplasmataceae bacterium CE_OT135]|nr:MAG: hypothetical protein MRECE_34c008 [Mycoplasmataceae bacterium CE_OT135]